MMNAKNREKIIIAFGIAVTLIILLSPVIARLYDGNTLLIGNEPYYHLRMATEITEHKTITFQDDKAGGRTYIAHIYDETLAMAAILMGGKNASIFLPILLGIGSLALFLVLTRYFGMMNKKRIIAAILLITTPTFIYTFSVSNEHALAIFLILLGAYLALKPGIWKAAGMVSLILAAYSSLFASLVITAIFMLYFLSDIKRNSIALWGALIAVLAAIIHNQGYIYQSEGLKGIISDLGASAGFGIFNLILASIGIISLLRRKKQHFFIFGMLAFLIASEFIFGNSANPYLAFVLAIFSAFGLSLILERHWELKALRELSILIIVLGLAFSGIVFVNRLAQSEPSMSTAESLMFLRSQEEGVVASQPSNGFLIEYFANKPVVADELSKNNLTGTLFYTTDLETAKKIMDNNSIRYIFIDSSMRRGAVWNKPDEGLLFLFRNNETFRKIHSQADTEVWEYMSR